jgi:alkaline phosphatase D
MGKMTRRQFVASAAAIGASVAWAKANGWQSRTAWHERRDLFAEGVASGDPAPDSVLLWTRVPLDGKSKVVPLTVEVAVDEAFEHVIATARANAAAAADYTCRVLVGGLKPARHYWYRFSTRDGQGSRIGRTRTAPAPGEDRAVRFAFVSCQNPCEGALNAYRRMIFEDERAADQLAFVLHLGDFIYEVVDYPEERPGGMRYDRKLRDLVRYKDGEKIPQGFHIPTSLADYRQLYRVYLHDPDLQDARARWPFVSMWDNHEFSWLGWQSFQRFGGESKPRQTRKVVAMQAWFEYQPARVTQSGGKSLEQFAAPNVREAPIDKFDEHGLGLEPNNLAAIGALKGYRRLQFGKHLDLIITDQHSYRSEEPTSQPEAASFADDLYPELFPQEVIEILDAGRTYADGKPPDTIDYGGKKIPNYRRSAPPQTILGAEQKQWFLNQLRTARATWKVWGASLGTLDFRVDPQNLPDGAQRPWPGAGYASFGGGDHSAAFMERAEIYDAVRNAGITGFLTVSGDRHSFWAGLSAKALPPKSFEPIGAAFITGSISSPGLVEAYEHRFPKQHPMRPLFLTDAEGKDRPEPAVNMLLRHGVRSCLEYQRTHDLAAARRVSNPDLSPHLSFVDMGGHGYALLRVAKDQADCEFVCIPRPIERSERKDGGPLRYRVVHRVALWRKGERPALEQRIVEGDPGLSI